MQEMVELSRDLLTNLLMLDSLYNAHPIVLKAMIEGKNLYEHNIGEFFLLYGKFEGEFRTKGSGTKDKMEKLIGTNSEHLKPYIDRGKKYHYPLPYAVRNILSHSGYNPNKLENNDLEKAINLLKE